MIYEGQFVNDQWHGYGRAIYKDGSYHAGYWKNDIKCGWGLAERKDRRSKIGWFIKEKGIWNSKG